jgi:hypothetical protein
VGKEVTKGKLNMLRQPVMATQFIERGSDTACGCAAPKAVELQIPYEVDCLDRNVNSLSNWLSDLECKLSPAIYQIPTPETGKSEKDAPLCTLAEKLRSINNVLISLRQRVEGTLAGLQI